MKYSTKPRHILQQDAMDRHKSRPVGAKIPELKETRFNSGSRYHLSVLNDDKGEPIFYRLRERPIDPQEDYTDRFTDFEIWGYADYHGKSAFDAVLEQFTQGNKEFDTLIEKSKYLK